MNERGDNALVEDLFRRSSAQAVSALVRRFGSARLADAEDAVQEAMVRALHHWPRRGVPDDPVAWIATVSRRAMLDRLRRELSGDRLAMALAERVPPTHTEVEEDALVMLFALAHPALAPEEQVALTLRVLGGFSAREVAAGLLLEESAAAQRLVRGRRKLAECAEPLGEWREAWVESRLEAVLTCVHLIFNEGWSASGGESWVREELVREGLRLARLVARHRTTRTGASLALLACLEWTAVRLPARLDPAGEPLGLAEQDRSLWDQAARARGNACFAASLALGNPTAWHARAALAGVHARAPSYGETDWTELVIHYDALVAMAPSPTAHLGRVVALAKVHGAERGLRELEALRADPKLAELGTFEAARGWMLWGLNRRDEARDAYRAALARERNGAAQRYLARRLEALEAGRGPID